MLAEQGIREGQFLDDAFIFKYVFHIQLLT